MKRRVGKGRFGSQIAEVLGYRLSFIVKLYSSKWLLNDFIYCINIIITTNGKYKSRVNSKSQAL